MADYLTELTQRLACRTWHVLVALQRRGFTIRKEEVDAAGVNLDKFSVPARISEALAGVTWGQIVDSGWRAWFVPRVSGRPPVPAAQTTAKQWRARIAKCVAFAPCVTLCCNGENHEFQYVKSDGGDRQGYWIRADPRAQSLNLIDICKLATKAEKVKIVLASGEERVYT